MLNIKWIRENPEELDNLLIKRGIQPMAKEIINLDEERRQIKTLIQQFQQAKNNKSRTLGQAKVKSGKEFEEAKRDVEHINQKLDELSARLQSSDKLLGILNNLPNMLESNVPYGTDESMNELVRTWGAINNIHNPKEHFELGLALGMMDFMQTAKISGSRFVTLKADLARLERALVSFMIDIHTNEFDFMELSPPHMVKPQAMYNVGQLPKFAEDSFVTTTDYRLIPTAEVPLTNMVADSILMREALPIRYVAHTQCFRSEAGSAGRDAKGMIRLHQFSKVELVSITTPDESEAEHEFITNAAEEILKRLELPYRVMLLCSGDTGFSSRKTYDIEVWLPGQKQYREISSCSNCGDFQARRMAARYKEFGATETTFVHTLNGSGLPIGRTIVAIMENYQNSDGSITVPPALVSYMGGRKKISPL